MSAYPPKELSHRWEHSQITIEQTIGQLIQHLLGLLQRLADLEKRHRRERINPLKPPTFIQPQRQSPAAQVPPAVGWSKFVWRAAPASPHR